MAAFPLVVVAAVLAIIAALPPVSTTIAQNDPRRAALEEKKRVAENECSYPKPEIPLIKPTLCHTLCLFKSFGALDKDGRYVESEMADMLYILSDFTRDQSNTIAKACNNMNEHIEIGCARASQVSACISNQIREIDHTTAQNDPRRAALEEKKRVAENECSYSKPEIPQPKPTLCHTLCMLKSFGALDKDGRYVESEMADLLYILSGFTRDQSNTIAKACNNMNEHIEIGCARASQVGACINNQTQEIEHVTGARN